MTRTKKLISVGVIILTIGVLSITALAASLFNSPTEVVANLTGQSVEQVIEQRKETGKTYGTIANEAGKLDEFKIENMQVKKDILNARVAEETMIREQADEIINAIEASQAKCDSTGSTGIGREYGASFGNASGKGTGQGQELGNGNRQEQELGNGNRQGNRAGSRMDSAQSS